MNSKASAIVFGLAAVMLILFGLPISQEGKPLLNFHEVFKETGPKPIVCTCKEVRAGMFINDAVMVDSNGKERIVPLGVFDHVSAGEQYAIQYFAVTKASPGRFVIKKI